MTIQGLHHISIVAGNAQRTIDFSVGVLGLRLVKQTVNFDDPSCYHIYFGDRTGTPGSAITFFEWPAAARGQPGVGGTHHVALTVADYAGLLKWKRRLIDLGIAVSGPLDRHYFTSIYLADPDGMIIEIATSGPGFAVDEPADRLGVELRAPPTEMMVRNRDEVTIAATTWPEPIPSITPDMALSKGMHHITVIGSNIHRTDEYYRGLLGLQLVKKTSNFDDPASAHWYWGVDGGRPGSLITYFERDARTSPAVRMGAGQTHHFAFSVATEDEQLAWRDRLMNAGVPVSPVMDRIYFKSIYTRDPDGHIVEIATAGPGFMVDEDVDHLGDRLQLPPWLESQRTDIESVLRPIQPRASIGD